ncbi:MAG: pentapeptide repeat-containing protein, partial [Xenococcaceae cyanobacterium]
MKRSRSIPRELIEDKAHKIWQKRALEGRDGTPEDDWNEAKKYLENHRGEVFLWKLGKVLNKLRKLIGRKVRASTRILWKLLTFPFLLLWRILTFPVWVFKTLHSLFVDSNSRAFALDIVKTFISAFGL